MEVIHESRAIDNPQLFLRGFVGRKDLSTKNGTWNPNADVHT